MKITKKMFELFAKHLAIQSHIRPILGILTNNFQFYQICKASLEASSYLPFCDYHKPQERIENEKFRLFPR